MKNLILIRHAKSSWEAPLKDFDRPLIKNGILDAHLVSSNISDFIPKTYLIWSSSARRASDTALIFAQNIVYPIESIVYKKELYTFDENQLEKEIKENAWVISKSNNINEVLTQTSSTLWKEKLNEIGGEYIYFSNSPENPTLN